MGLTALLPTRQGITGRPICHVQPKMEVGVSSLQLVTSGAVIGVWLVC